MPLLSLQPLSVWSYKKQTCIIFFLIHMFYFLSEFMFITLSFMCSISNIYFLSLSVSYYQLDLVKILTDGTIETFILLKLINESQHKFFSFKIFYPFSYAVPC